MQLLTKGDLADCWLDGAHNDGGAEVIAKHIAANNTKPWVLIMGMMHTKDARAYLRHFIGKVREIYTISIPNEPNAKSAFELASMARSLAFNASPCESATDAKQKILAIHGDKVNILITGSLYLAGKILENNS